MKKSHLFTVAALVATLSPAQPRMAAEITVSGYAGSSTLVNFPVLVRISPTRISGFSYADCAEGGADISFQDAAGNALDFEVDTWDASGDSLVWVKVPSLSGNATKITFCWNDAAPAARTPAATWSGYTGVWHLNEEEAGAVAIADATANGVNGTAHSTSSSKTDGKVGRARNITTNTGHTPASGVGGITIDSANMSAIDAVTPEFTVSMWARTLNTKNNYEYFISRKLADADQAWAVQLMNSYNPASLRFYSAGTADNQVANPNPQIKGAMGGVWHKYDFIWKSDGTYAIYIDGSQNSSVGNNLTGNLYNKAVAVNGAYPLCIGGTYPEGSGKGGRGFYGDMDEVRICAGVLSADWIAADYAQVNDPSFVTYGAAYSMANDSSLRVFALPAEIGSPTPAYGVVENLSAGSPVVFSMAATAVAGEGTITNYLKGWKLESVNLETGARTLLRTSSDAGEAIDRYVYVHASYAEFTWLWDVRDALGVGTPAVVSKGQNSISLSAAVTGIGYTAPSATLKFAYGPSADALLYTNVVSASVTEIGAVQGTLTRLTPGGVYYIQAVIETNDGAHDVAASEAICVQTDTLFENGEPGLWQTFFTGAKNDWTRDIWALPVGTDWHNYTDANRIRRREITPIGAYTGGNPLSNCSKYVSEVWGDEVIWPANGGQWAYAGHIWLDASKSYKFRTNMDDYAYIAITDAATGTKTVVIERNSNGSATSDTYSPSVTGWHLIEMRFADNTGGVGGCSTSGSHYNTTSLGISYDDGTTWELLQDPGDGSLLRASPTPQGLSTISASENIEDGALASVALSFAAADSARALRAVWGPAHGGNNPAGWLATSAVATVAAGATSASWTPPADWGSDSNLVVRFYFDAPLEWSDSIFWHDYSVPSVTDVAADGTGGDTLLVSGNLAFFSGANCTLTVYTGDSPTTLDHAWTGVTDSVRAATGDFTLTLFEPDTASPRYLAPGSSLYVAVEAAADGLVSRTEPVAVKMEAAPAFANSSSSVSRHTVTFTGALSDLGMDGAATVTLYVGASSDAEGDLVAAESAVVTNTASFTLRHVFPAFETTYRWQLRAVATSAGGTATLETRRAVATAMTRDTTTYTWKPAVASGNWSDAANWTDDQGGDCLGYPRTSAATAVFPAGTAARVAFTEALSVGTVTMTADNLELVFTQGGASTNATKLTSSNFNANGKGGCITLDGVAVASGSNLDLGTGRALKVVNGANLNVKILYQDEGQEVLLAGGSFIACTENHFGGGTFTIDDSTLLTSSHDYVGRGKVGGHVVFAGSNPLWIHGNKDTSFCASLANADVQLDFLVPVGGFASAPIQSIPNQTPKYFMGNNAGSAGASALTVNVLDESPANFADETVTSPLILWPAKGVNKDMVLEGHLPVWGVGTATDDAFAWNDPEAANPTNLSVRIVGSSHAAQLQVSGYPEAVASAALSPSYGYTALAADATRTCTAPADYVYLSETKRALCTGWKLYDVDAATLARTLADSGDTASAPVTGTGLWQELEWQWRIEYKVAVTAGAGGTAAASETWVADGATVTVSATPDTGYGFAGWSGDVTNEDRMKPSFSFTVNGRGYALAASFHRAYYVAKDGNDANDGLSATTPLATVGEALARGAPHIYVAAGVYDIASALIVENATTIEGTGSDQGAVIRATKAFKEETRAFAIQLLHVDAALRNLAITTAASESSTQFAGGVRMIGGLIDNCAITNCIVSSVHAEGCNGGGAHMSGGIIRNTLFDRNSVYGSGQGKGGGNLHAAGGLVENCIFRRGGAAYRSNLSHAGISATGGAVIRNCLIEGNVAASGTGFAVTLRNATMENCTVVGNSAPTATSGSALYINPDNNNPVVIRNTIVWGNTTAGGLSNWARANANAFTAERIVTVPAMPGKGNTDADPLFRDFANGDYRPTLGSARNAGVLLDWMDTALDVDGNPRIAEGAPDIGCHEYVPAALDCSFDVSAGGTLDADEVTLAATVLGADLDGLVYRWTITDQDGNETARSGADLATLVLTLGPGFYSVALDVENGAHDTASYARNNVVTVFPSHIYVNVNGANRMPFASYADGATNLLDAVAFATDGTTIHVADGFYRYASEIILNNAIRIVSENGPTNVFFLCTSAPHGLRSVNLANAGALVGGITITGIDTDNPASGTHSVYRYDLRKSSGTAPGVQPDIGGVRITAAGGTVTNCLIVNHRGGTGAGANIAGGTVVDCLFTNNWNYGAVSWSNSGGIEVNGVNALVERCAFFSNCVYHGVATWSFGGGANVSSGTLRNCLFVGNHCIGYGGNLAVQGANAHVYHCTGVRGYGSLGNGGLYHASGVVADCIFYDNFGNTAAEDSDDPGFADYAAGDFHLSAASPAVDAATSGMGGDLDLDHTPRVSGPAADLGCFEYDKSQFAIGIANAADSSFSDDPVTLTAIVSPEGTLLDEAQTWWTFDGTEPSASNHDAVGSTVTRLFCLGTWTVRFKTVHEGRTYSVDKADWFTRYGRTVYLARENPGSAFPYGTPATAATNVFDAMACALDGATILVGDGVYPFLDGMQYIARNLVIRSENGPGRATFDANGKSGMFCIRSGDWRVVIDGIRFVNGYGNGDGLGTVTLRDADSVITNCVFDSCHTSLYGSGGGGVRADAGIIVDCLFTNCWFSGTSDINGVAIRAGTADCLVDRCVVVGARYSHASPGLQRGAIFVQNGIVRDTVVSGSRLTGVGGIYAAGAAKVQNCTVVDNVTERAGHAAGVEVADSATVRNTILWNNVNAADAVRAETGGAAARFDHCYTGNPQLVGKPGRAFEIHSNSPCRNAGVTEEWMAGALDVYGRPRLDKPRHPVDIGASECQRTDGTMLIMR